MVVTPLSGSSQRWVDPPTLPPRNIVPTNQNCDAWQFKLQLELIKVCAIYRGMAICVNQLARLENWQSQGRCNSQMSFGMNKFGPTLLHSVQKDILSVASYSEKYFDASYRERYFLVSYVEQSEYHSIKKVRENTKNQKNYVTTGHCWRRKNITKVQNCPDINCSNHSLRPLWS